MGMRVNLQVEKTVFFSKETLQAFGIFFRSAVCRDPQYQIKFLHCFNSVQRFCVIYFFCLSRALRYS